MTNKKRGVKQVEPGSISLEAPKEEGKRGEREEDDKTRLFYTFTGTQF
jgi:hypothetical protein